MYHVTGVRRSEQDQADTVSVSEPQKTQGLLPIPVTHGPAAVPCSW